jgi:formylglycine-generating enzyme required for sulfatase activity
VIIGPIRALLGCVADVAERAPMHVVISRARLCRAAVGSYALSLLLVLSTLAGAGAAAAGPGSPRGAAADAGGPVVTLATVRVGAPGNPSVGVVPFQDAVYRSCADAPTTTPGCLTVGGVGYRYEIGQLEVTVGQWVAFLNTADPEGRDPHDLYDETESASEWPKYGQINFSAAAGSGRHYSVAYPEWAQKPYGFADFLRAARFVNSLYNGRLISETSRTRGRFGYVTYQVALSPRTESGMYDLTRRDATRAHASGFVVPSQNEWIKAAYYDPDGGGTDSYWKYPTNEGVFGDGDNTAPNPTVLTPTTGEVTNTADRPLATYHADGLPAPSWCPVQVQPAACSGVNPFGLDSRTYTAAYQGSLSTVGQARTTSPWGTLDQGGNAVEWTDTITAPPSGRGSGRVWRRLHGGVANSPAYQMWLSAVGLQPQDNLFYNRTYPWLGFRIGVIGDLGARLKQR